MGVKNEFQGVKILDKILPFFPAPFPDEAITSQIGRYHILRGHRTERATYDELFQAAPFTLTYWVPYHIDRLAKRLPGSPEANHATLIKDGTLLPLFRTFGRMTYEGAAGQKFQSIKTEVPRRIVGESGITHLCLSCVVEDMDNYGAPYIHRAHQIPGVTACWKHETKTIERCPSCKCPFEIPKSLILSPWKACACGRAIDSFANIEEQATPMEIDFARFAKDLLHGAEAIEPELLVKVYKNRILGLGFRRGKSQIARTKLLAAIEESYDQEQLKKMDFAHRKGRLSGWLNLLSATSAQEAPLGRHLLFAHFLFREAKLFLNSVKLGQSEIITPPSSVGTLLPREANEAAPRRSRKVLAGVELLDMLTEVAVRNSYGLEDLWIYQFGAMKRLVKFDHDAPQRILARISNDSLRKSRTPSSQKRTTLYDRQADEKWAEAIQAASVLLYASAEKPVKITMNRLLKEAAVKGSTWPNALKFPLVYAVLEQCSESQWYFYARCMVWVIHKYPEHAGRGSKLVKLAKLESHKGVAVFQHLSQIGGQGGLSPNLIISILQNLGIPKDWRGPNPDQDFYVTGRRYIRRERLPNSKPISV